MPLQWESIPQTHLIGSEICTKKEFTFIIHAILLNEKCKLWIGDKGALNDSNTFVARGSSLVDSVPFVRRVAVSNPALAATYWDHGQVLHSQLPVAIQREERHSIQVVSGTPRISSEFEEALEK